MLGRVVVVLFPSVMAGASQTTGFPVAFPIKAVVVFFARKDSAPGGNTSSAVSQCANGMIGACNGGRVMERYFGLGCYSSIVWIIMYHRPFAVAALPNPHYGAAYFVHFLVYLLFCPLVFACVA